MEVLDEYYNNKRNLSPDYVKDIEEYLADVEEINERNGKAGDHLKVTRFAYEHHGIYIGNGKVIEYDGPEGGGLIQETTLFEFAGDGLIQKVPSPKVYSSKTIIERAKSRLGEKEYNLISNNCEHFCNWCRSGIHFSFQVVAGIPYSIVNFMKNLSLKMTQVGREQEKRLKQEKITREVLHYLLISRIDYQEFTKKHLQERKMKLRQAFLLFDKGISQNNIEISFAAINSLCEFTNLKLPYKNFEEFDKRMINNPQELMFWNK